VVKRLTDAGAIILGKTNLSEWANIRSSRSISGWSAAGGLVKNPNVLDRNACGSSSGTGAAIAASLAAVGVGTETDGSVTCPSAVNGLAGIKPTLGLVSRTHIVPISHSQDTAGPMGRSVEDIALLLTAMAGSDPADPATKTADAHKTDYRAALKGASLKGKRIGVLRYAAEVTPPEAELFEAALAAMRHAGVTIVEIKAYKPAAALGDAEFKVLLTELKSDLNAYLASTDPAKVKTRTLADVIAFNKANPRELALFGQETFEQAQRTKGLKDPAYLKARALSLRLAGRDGIDKLLRQYRLDALTAPTTVPAWLTDSVDGDHVEGEGATSLAAVAGYPHATLPMGYVRDLPVAISFIGGAWRDAEILRIAYAYEQISHARRAPAYIPSLETAAPVADLLAPPK
jgi:amidase